MIMLANGNKYTKTRLMLMPDAKMFLSKTNNAATALGYDPVDVVFDISTMPEVQASVADCETANPSYRAIEQWLVANVEELSGGTLS